MTLENTPYKDYFEVTDHLEAESVDFNYRKAVISEENVFKEEKDNIVSFEKFNAAKTSAILEYLNYKLPSVNDKKQRLWFVKNINFFSQLLTVTDQEKTFITPSFGFVHRVYEMKTFKEDSKIGRLYNKFSIQTLPREIRFYMFKEDYVDFDISNSHPTLLYKYSKTHKLKLNGALQQYVADKKAIMIKIQKEMEESTTLKKPSYSEIKELVIKLLNKTWDLKKPHKSKTFILLEKDFDLVRNHLWDSFISGEYPDLKAPLEESINKPAKKAKYIKNGIIDFVKLHQMKKVIVQSFYFQTQETLHLLKLTSFLRRKYDKFLIQEDKSLFTDFYPYPDKKIKLSSKHTLFIIPFFDGLYLSSPCKSFMADLSNLVDEYNTKESDCVIFVQKEIDEEIVHLTDTEELRKFFIINTWLSTIESSYYLDLFIRKKKINEKILKLMTKQQEMGKKGRLDTEEKEKEWEKIYTVDMSLLKNEIYESLLEFPIKEMKDIEISIRELSNEIPEKI